jgi:hypothetical protein
MNVQVYHLMVASKGHTIQCSYTQYFGDRTRRYEIQNGDIIWDWMQNSLVEAQ